MSLSQSEIKELIKRVPPPPKTRPEPPTLHFYIRLYLDDELCQQGYFCRVYINDDLKETDKHRKAAPEKPDEFQFEDIDLSEHVLISLYKSNSKEVGSMRFPLVSLEINTVTEAALSIHCIDLNENKNIKCLMQVATTDTKSFSNNANSNDQKSDEDDKKSDEESSDKDKKKHKKDKDKKEKKDKKSRKGK